MFYELNIKSFSFFYFFLFIRAGFSNSLVCITPIVFHIPVINHIPFKTLLLVVVAIVCECANSIMDNSLE